MIFRFRVVSDEVDNFKREIEIDADATFLQLKNAICESVGYDKSQMCSFFLCNNDWEKEREITMEDMGSEADEEVYLMDETILSDYIEDEGQRLMFTYDYMTDRSFFLEMKEMITGKSIKDPLCTLAIGQAPAQNIDFDDFEKQVDTKAAAAAAAAADDMDEEFYGSSEFSDDEFDAAGFDEMTFDN